MEVSEVAEEVADAVERLSRSGIGAIIALEREIALGDYVRVGHGDAGEGVARICWRRSSRRTRRCTTAR